MESRLESLEADKKALTDDADRPREEIKSMSADIELLFKERWSDLNMLCKNMLEISGEKFSQKEVCQKMDKELKRIINSEKIADVETSIDYYMQGLVSKLRLDFPEFKEEEIRILYLSMVGFSPRSISLLTGVKTKTVYQKHSRLVDKIEKADVPNKDVFLIQLTGWP